MFSRLKTLTSMQLNNMKNKTQVKSKSSRLVSVLLEILAIAFITFVLYYFLNTIKSYYLFPINQNLLLFVLFITQYIGILTTTFGLSKSLYESRDNSIIFSLPAKSSEIYLSRLTIYYFSELHKGLYFVFPFFVAFGLSLKLDLIFFVWTAIFAFVLPLITVLIAAIFSLPLMLYKRLSKRFPIIRLIVVLTIAGLVMWALYSITKKIPRPLNILAFYDVFSKRFALFIANAEKYSLFYRNIVNIFFDVKLLYNFAMIISLIIGLLLVVLVNTVTYYSIVSNSIDQSVRMKKKTYTNKVTKNTFWTFTKKEFKLQLRNSNEMINHILFLVALPFVLFLVNEILSAISTNILGNNIVVTLNIFIALLMLTSSNTMSASAITSEGSEFGLIKTAPSDTSKMCWAKIFVNFAFSLVSIVATMITLSLITEIKTIYLWLMFVIIFCVNSAHILWSFQLDLLKPRLNDYAATGNLNNNPNVKKSVLIGLLLAVLFAVLTLILLINGNPTNVARLMLIAIALLLAKLYLFVLNLKVYFSHIEF